MTFTATALGRAATVLIIDKYGRRNMLVIDLIIFAGGSLLCAVAPNYPVLAAGRFVVGLGLGGEISVAVIMVAEFFAAKHRGTAVGLINVTAAGLGNMLAQAFGILVFTLFDGPDFAPELYPTRTRGFGTAIILAAGSLSGGLFPLMSGLSSTLQVSWECSQPWRDSSSSWASWCSSRRKRSVNPSKRTPLRMKEPFMVTKSSTSEKAQVLLINPNTTQQTTKLMSDLAADILEPEGPDIVGLTAAGGPAMIIEPDSLAGSLRIPVVGIGQASIQSACGEGRRFGMATSTPCSPSRCRHWSRTMQPMVHRRQTDEVRTAGSRRRPGTAVSGTGGGSQRSQPD